MRRPLVVIAAALAIAGMVWLGTRSSPATSEPPLAVDDWTVDARFDFETFAKYLQLSEEESADHAEWVRDFGDKERSEYLQTFSLLEIAKEFPVSAGMTIAEMDNAIAENQRNFRDSDSDQKDEMYNFGWEQRDVHHGRGWIYYWVNWKHLLHCDIVIASGRVQSVWVMPGNKEWQTGIYYRISGGGAHQGPGRIW